MEIKHGPSNRTRRRVFIGDEHHLSQIIPSPIPQIGTENRVPFTTNPDGSVSQTTNTQGLSNPHITDEQLKLLEPYLRAAAIPCQCECPRGQRHDHDDSTKFFCPHHVNLEFTRNVEIENWDDSHSAIDKLVEEKSIIDLQFQADVMEVKAKGNLQPELLDSTDYVCNSAEALKVKDYQSALLDRVPRSWDNAVALEDTVMSQRTGTKSTFQHIPLVNINGKIRMPYTKVNTKKNVIPQNEIERDVQAILESAKYEDPPIQNYYLAMNTVMPEALTPEFGVSSESIRADDLASTGANDLTEMVPVSVGPFHDSYEFTKGEMDEFDFHHHTDRLFDKRASKLWPVVVLDGAKNLPYPHGANLTTITKHVTSTQRVLRSLYSNLSMYAEIIKDICNETLTQQQAMGTKKIQRVYMDEIVAKISQKPVEDIKRYVSLRNQAQKKVRFIQSEVSLLQSRKYAGLTPIERADWGNILNISRADAYIQDDSYNATDILEFVYPTNPGYYQDLIANQVNTMDASNAVMSVSGYNLTNRK